MTNTEPNTKAEAVKKINRTVAKYIVIRVFTGVGITVAGVLIANALDRKLNPESDQDTTENNE